MKILGFFVQNCCYNVKVPLSVWHDWDSILEPLDLCVVLLAVDGEDHLVILHALLALQLARELVREFLKWNKKMN